MRAPRESAETWCDAEGAPVAFGGWSRERCWIEVPNVGEYSFAFGGGDVQARLVDGVDPGFAAETFERMVLPLVLQARGREVLHASAVLAPAGVVAFCGVSGTGKSSLADALGAIGYPPCADDAVSFDPAGTHPLVELLPFRLKIGDAVAARGSAVSPALPERAPLASIGILIRDAGAASPVMVRLRDATAFTALIEHAYCFTLAWHERTRTMVENYLRLVAQVPVLEVRFRPDRENVPALARDVAAAVAAAVAS